MSEKKRKRFFARSKVFVEDEISAFSSFLSKISFEFSKKKIKIVVVVVFSVVRMKIFHKNKISRYFDNFVKISLTCVKVRRSALFDSSMISAISFVEKYDFANSVTIIVNRFSVSMSVSLRFFIKRKKRNSTFDFVRFLISRLVDVVFFSTFFNVVFFSTSSTLFDALSDSSTSFDVESVFSTRFFVLFSNNYRDSLSVRRFRFFFENFSKRISRFISFFN